MRPNIRKILTVILAAVFVISGAQLVVHEVKSRQGRQAYDEAARLAGLVTPQQPVQQMPPEQVTTLPSEVPAPTTAETMPTAAEPVVPAVTETAAEPSTSAADTQPDLAALQTENADVIGWITIPDTILSYPLLQGEDNDYYLNRTWKKEYNALGSIYLDYRNDPALTDHHSIIYGHRMRHDDMFGSLRYYKKHSYWKEHPELQITTAAGTACYQIFAAYETDTVTGHVYQLGLEGQARQTYIDACIAASVIDTGVVPTAEQSIITLSTCTAQGSASRNRWVVQAALKVEE